MFQKFTNRLITVNGSVLSLSSHRKDKYFALPFVGRIWASTVQRSYIVTHLVYIPSHLLYFSIKLMFWCKNLPCSSYSDSLTKNPCVWRNPINFSIHKTSKFCICFSKYLNIWMLSRIFSLSRNFMANFLNVTRFSFYIKFNLYWKFSSNNNPEKLPLWLSFK